MAEWYEGLDADTLAHATGKGWEKLAPDAAAAEAVKAHYAAQKLIGVPSDQVLKLPKDAADPAFQAVYDRVVGMAIPKTAEDYKFGEGTPEEDAKFVRELAVKHKLPVPAAQALATDLAARNASLSETAKASIETTRAANRAHLMAAWGSDFDRKSFSALNALEAAGLPKSILETIAALPAEEYRRSMDAVVALGEKMGEAAMLRGGGPRQADPTAGMTPQDAQARLTALNTDMAWGAKLKAGDVATHNEWLKLCTIVASGRVAPR